MIGENVTLDINSKKAKIRNKDFLLMDMELLPDFYSAVILHLYIILGLDYTFFVVTEAHRGSTQRKKM